MPDFFQTVMGKRFYEGTMPALVKAIEENTRAIEKLVEALEKDRKEDTE